MKPLPLNVSNDALNIIIGLATLIIGLTAFGIEFGENKYLKFAKSLWFRIPTMIVFSIIIIWATVVKDKNNDVRNSNDLLVRDSVNQKKLNESLSKASTATSVANAETMAKYYLKYDSAQRKVERLVKDSSKKITYNSPDIRPELTINKIQLDGYRNDSLWLRIYIHNEKIKADSVNIEFFTFTAKKDNFFCIPPKTYMFNKNGSIGTDQTFTAKRFILSFVKNLDRVVFYFKGYYYGNKIKYPFESLMEYNIKEQSFGVFEEPFNTILLNQFRKSTTQSFSIKNNSIDLHVDP